MAGTEIAVAVDIDAPADRVWRALTDPEDVATYMMGAEVDTDWQVGSPIYWRGEFQGKPFEDKGEVLEVDEPHRLSVTHYSPLSGAADKPENYHTLTYVLSEKDGRTHLELTQDNAGGDEEAEHSRSMWTSMLAGLKNTAEGG